MHEVSLMGELLELVDQAARDAGAVRVTRIELSIGDMTEVVPEALDFAFEALSPGTVAQGAQLAVNYIKPKSVCLDCGHEFTHDRYHLACPACSSLSCKLVAGRELSIDGIEVDLPDGA